jgi:hypothetical protein
MSTTHPKGSYWARQTQTVQTPTVLDVKEEHKRQAFLESTVDFLKQAHTSMMKVPSSPISYW